MKWYFAALRRYAMLDGRARRKEFWYFVLFNIFAGMALLVVDGAAGTFSLEEGIGWLSGLYLLAILTPSIAVSVRRLHDSGRSGWWLLLGLIPISGALVLFAFVLEDGEPGENQYGANPRGRRV